MSEPTAEQIADQHAEAVFVLSATRLEYGPGYWALHRRIATALARVRIEALEACEKVASDIAEREEEKQGYYGPAAATGDEIADAIRALRGRT